MTFHKFRLPQRSNCPPQYRYCSQYHNFISVIIFCLHFDYSICYDSQNQNTERNNYRCLTVASPRLGVLSMRRIRIAVLSCILFFCYFLQFKTLWLIIYLILFVYYFKQKKLHSLFSNIYFKYCTISFEGDKDAIPTHHYWAPPCN